MSRKKESSWLDEEYTPNQEKLPTIRQYLKELSEDVTNINSTVRLIWCPGQWDNYTLQCDDFRVIIGRRDRLYAILGTRIDEFTKGSKTLDVCITNRKPLSYRLVENNELSGGWFFIGDGPSVRFVEDVGEDVF